MKVGFGKKKKSKRKNSKNKKDGESKVDSTEIVMKNAKQPEAPACAADDAATSLSAKDRQKHKMELKQSLKAKVNSMKKSRAKTRKLPANIMGKNFSIISQPPAQAADSAGGHDMQVE